nr:MAG TPA: hypothetical protein [Caudoviricetes sp.]
MSTLSSFDNSKSNFSSVVISITLSKLRLYYHMYIITHIFLGVKPYSIIKVLCQYVY